MADSNIIKVNLQTTGSNSGTWGTITNENLEKVEETLKGFIAVPITGATTTLSNPSGGNGLASQTAKITLKLTGTLGATTSVETTASVDNFYLVEDATTRAGNTLLFGPAGGTKVTLVEGAKHLIFVDGGSNTAFDVFSDMGNVKANGTLEATGNVTLNGGDLTFNAAGANKDATFSGVTEANLFKVDASTDRVGIATNSPGTTLDVAGTFKATGAITLAGVTTTAALNVTDAKEMLVSRFNVTSPDVPPPLKLVPATTDVMSPCGAKAAIEAAVTVLGVSLSSTSAIITLSFDATVAEERPVGAKLTVTEPELPPPDKPVPAVTPVMSPTACRLTHAEPL